MLEKLSKYKKLILVILIIPVLLLFGFKFYIKEIENHYKNLQELFYESESGYIIINKTTHEFGIVKKKWNRATITANDVETDLYHWVYKKGHETKIEIYRPKLVLKNINFDNLNYSQVMDKIRLSELVYITGN